MRRSYSFQKEVGRFLWNLIWVPTRFHPQEHLFSAESGQAFVEPAVGSGSRFQWVPARLHAQELWLSVGMCRFLWNLIWVPTRFHVQEHWFSTESGQVLVEPTVGSCSRFLWNLKCVYARLHAQEPQFSAGNV